MYKTLTLEITNGICVVTINRPEKMNALNRQVFDDLEAAVDEIYANEEIKSAMITGAGSKAFVAGADIGEFTSLHATDSANLARRGQDVLRKIENAPKPIVAAVNGFALGGGCELALACH
ncbi:MAG TPA: enoyl-CoA hydratase-related protein, partial [Chitinophagaceae bacterium]